ncbi:MAG: hypothetical protein PVF43_14415 [Candidatus Eiseniibacteriota bacterium]|jgi:hypothetical protein
MTKTLLQRALPGLCLVALLATTAVASTGEGSGEIIRFDFWGFSIAPEPQEPGDVLQVVAAMNAGTTSVPLALDFARNEYTVYIHSARLESVVQNGPLIEYHYDGGYVDLFEDPAFNAPFQSTTSPDEVPPLDPSEVPAYFVDGSHLLRFAFRDLVTLFYEPAGIGTIAYTASELRATGGKAYRDLHDMHMTIGWHLGGGYTNDQGAYIPEGYGMRYDALLQWENPLPVESSTWGGIKASFR